MKTRFVPFTGKRSPRLGDMVYLPDTGVVGEVVEISDEVQNLVTKIKLVGADGRVTYMEVADVTVLAIQIARKVVRKGWFKRLLRWFGIGKRD